MKPRTQKKSKYKTPGEVIIKTNFTLEQLRRDDPKANRQYEEAMFQLLLPQESDLDGKIVLTLDNGVIKEMRVTPVFKKMRMMKIYHKYADYYELMRDEYLENNHDSFYGAEQYAIEKMQKEIELKEGIRIKQGNLKQAMTRIFIRRPIKRRNSKD